MDVIRHCLAKVFFGNLSVQEFSAILIFNYIQEMSCSVLSVVGLIESVTVYPSMLDF